MSFAPLSGVEVTGAADEAPGNASAGSPARAAAAAAAPPRKMVRRLVGVSGFALFVAFMAVLFEMTRRTDIAGGRFHDQVSFAALRHPPLCSYSHCSTWVAAFSSNRTKTSTFRTTETPDVAIVAF